MSVVRFCILQEFNFLFAHVKWSNSLSHFYYKRIKKEFMMTLRLLIGERNTNLAKKRLDIFLEIIKSLVTMHRFFILNIDMLLVQLCRHNCSFERSNA